MKRDTQKYWNLKSRFDIVQFTVQGKILVCTSLRSKLSRQELIEVTGSDSVM